MSKYKRILFIILQYYVSKSHLKQSIMCVSFQDKKHAYLFLKNFLHRAFFKYMYVCILIYLFIYLYSLIVFYATYKIMNRVLNFECLDHL